MCHQKYGSHFKILIKKKDSLLINFSSIIHDKKEVINLDYEQI